MNCTICDVQLKQGYYKSIMYSDDPGIYIPFCPPCCAKIRNYIIEEQIKSINKIEMK